MLVAHLDGSRIEAWDAEPGPAYVCPDCRGRLTLKRGRLVIPHFAHVPPSTCASARGETQAHLVAKRLFRDAFRRRGLAAEIEWDVLSRTGDRRADVVVWSPRDRPVAIELQHRPIGLEEIERRTRAYLSASVPVIWIAFLAPEARLPSGLPPAAPARIGIERYSASRWQRWAHGYGFGALWFYEPGEARLWCGRLRPERIFVEERVRFEHGREVRGGGFWRLSRRWKRLELSGPFAIGDVRIGWSCRGEARLGAYLFPGGPLARLVAPERRALGGGGPGEGASRRPRGPDRFGSSPS